MSGLHVFNIGDIPVRVSLWYGLLLLFWAQGGGSARATMVWAAVVTVSILVHELGHALVARYYRLRPGILLHGLGGLCHHDRAARDRDDAIIIAAGPGAGLLLGLLTWGASVVADRADVHSPVFWQVVSMSLYVNIGWSLINLLPLWPLDGGQLFRLLMLRFARPKLAERVTHYTALVTLAGGFYLGYQSGSNLLMLLALWIGWSNVSQLMGTGASGPLRATNRGAKLLLQQSKDAYAAGDFKEAARIGHQLRHEPNVAEKIAKEGQLLLGLSSARIGDHETSLALLRDARPTADVVEARIECLFALRRDRELSELLASEDFNLIGTERRQEILSVVKAEVS